MGELRHDNDLRRAANLRTLRRAGPPARVKALLGIECSEKPKRLRYTATQENLSEAGSWKLNDDGISVAKKRRTIHKK